MGPVPGSPLFTRHDVPEIDAPVLVLGMEGWIDAGLGAGSAVAHLLERIPMQPVATFDGDALVDYRARRPMVHITDGVVEKLTWPDIELRAGRDAAGRHVLALVGPEPDMRWRAFIDAVVGLGAELGVRLAVALGAFPLSVPHTRPVRLAATATSRELAERIGVVPGSQEFPAGVHGALLDAFGAGGVPAVSLWARVPHYAARMPYPAASAALLEGLAEVAGIEVDTTELHAAAAITSGRIDELFAASEQHATMVRQLEAMVDAEAGPPPLDPSNLPSGDEIGAELERFLRGEAGGAG